ncbi:putative nucleic acid-binding protein [Bradyrhizobium sp. USDA 4503]
MVEKTKYYWDACAWIALIQQEEGRFSRLKHLIEQAQSGGVEIWTSNFTLAEVYKRPLTKGLAKQLPPDKDSEFEAYILQSFVTRVQVDYDVGTCARTLLRKYPTIVKPQDGIHVATALLNNVDELHTFDHENLIDLSGKIARLDGKMLKICLPPEPPKPAEPVAPPKTPMEEFIDESKTEDAKKASGSA